MFESWWCCQSYQKQPKNYIERLKAIKQVNKDVVFKKLLANVNSHKLVHNNDYILDEYRKEKAEDLRLYIATRKKAEQAANSKPVVDDSKEWVVIPLVNINTKSNMQQPKGLKYKVYKVIDTVPSLLANSTSSMNWWQAICYHLMLKTWWNYQNDSIVKSFKWCWTLNRLLKPFAKNIQITIHSHHI